MDEAEKQLEGRGFPWVQILFVATLVALSFFGSTRYVLDLETELLQSIALDSGKQYTTVLEEFRTLYSSEVVERARQKGIEVTHNYIDQPGAIPLPATLSMLLGARLDKLSGGSARLYSAYPFPWRRDGGGPLDPFEEEALKTLQKQPDLPFYRFESDKEFPRLRYAIADRMREACVGCHNSHKESPKTDWEVGDVRGVLSVSIPLSYATAQARTGLRGVLALILGAFAVGLLALGLSAIRLRSSAMNAARFAERTRQMNVALNTEISQRERVEAQHREMQAGLLQAQKLESLGLLAGGIAHDFNNFLQGIVGHAQLSSLKLDPENGAQENLNQVQDLVKQAVTLTEQLLSYAGKTPIERHPVNLSELVRDMKPLTSTMSGGALDIEYVLDESLPMMEGAPAQLRQVVLNLLTNGADAVEENRGSVRVSTGVTEMPTFGEDGETQIGVRRCVYLVVRDTGQGMTSETLSKAFDPFFTTKDKGRGLGLAALQGIVRGHDGTMEVDTEPGVGTTFKVTFPVVDKPIGVPAKVSPRVASSAVGSILIVDDYEYVGKVAAETLEKRGYDVLLASDGFEAVDLFKANTTEITAVVLDLVMPDMNGAETFRALREIRSDIPVIIVSGNPESTLLAPLLEEPKVMFLSKPYSWPELCGAVEHLLVLQS